MTVVQALSGRAVQYRKLKRRYVGSEIDYLILVPTLRCNLSCSYCQVSRASENAQGFDWSSETEAAVLAFLNRLDTKKIKIEFQGGEPLLVLPMLERIRHFCLRHFAKCEFVVCTNLQSVSDDAWHFLSNNDVFVSTSLDGTIALHEHQRTKNTSSTQSFISNLDKAIRLLGPSQISALPTLDVNNLPEPIEIIETYSRFGFNSIYLRPIAHYGFARKAHASQKLGQRWSNFHRQFIEELIRYNYSHNATLEEFYFSHCLRRVLRPGENGHVDLRNPNYLGTDYLVIDYDGTIYPTDEARMLTRTKQIDLSIGHVQSHIDQNKLSLLNANTSNDDDPACKQCKYQPFCGRDVIDDLARYGRIDLDRHETEFCNRHMAIFNHLFELLDNNDPAVAHSLALWAGVPEFDPLLREVLL